METYVWDVRNYVDDLSTYPQIDSINAAFHSDELIAIPTETVYGLAANAFSPEAVGKVYTAKGRPSDNPLIVHIHQMDQLEFADYIHPAARQLMDVFWPGAISFILPVKPDRLAPQVTAGLSSVAVRMPEDKVARQLLRIVGLPLAAPSANLSGRPSPTQFQHVQEDLEGRIFGIIQGPDSEIGIESTVLDCTSYPFKIARPGSITESMLLQIVPGCLTEAHYEPDTPIAPGMKYRHYAPNSPMTLIEGGIQEPLTIDSQTAVIAPESSRHLIEGGHFYPLCATETAYKEAAGNLYDVLRMIDHNHAVKRIILSGFTRTEETRALMNRIDKASAGE
ncbi:L-threonylcarbamoyladenylate synthase [Macrococcus lamae]|uniref:Threonylcarbamoyl-AMP synthase n=1 Tax=Macrococcus lamae TaxID=198484 RepID=A0A4R6BU22_9STAP|nr:L-threonylcarbamoyladenylate synthase [Macrococcus lamae]TDM10528.1 threonylcarbamoyl-AMP synthase [Macrococcus lamae]